jgi:hypothetical protein
VTIETLPFDSYPHGGRSLLGKAKGDLARRGYGRQALAWCDFACAYCGLDMSVFEGWLQLSVDHVIPQQSVTTGFPAAWVLDATNIVACCRSCNDLFNRDPHVDAVPESIVAFYDLRDRLYLARRARIIERRAEERAWFEDNVLPAATKAKEPAAGPLYSHAWLPSSGFEGFVPVSSLQRSHNAVPAGPGVYVVLRDTAAPPRFLATSKGGRFKDRDPTVCRWSSSVAAGTTARQFSTSERPTLSAHGSAHSSNSPQASRSGIGAAAICGSLRIARPFLSPGARSPTHAGSSASSSQTSRPTSAGFRSQISSADLRH